MKGFALFFSLIFFSTFFSTSWAIPQEGQKIMISAATPEAVEAGKRIAHEGGNAIDVAVGVALTLSVTSPMNAAFGGGGFAMVKAQGKVYVLDFREKAPQKTNPTYYLGKSEKASTDGGTAVGVPGNAAGLWALHKKFGKLKWEKLFREALDLSSRGFVAFRQLSIDIDLEKNRFNPSAKAVLFNGKFPKISGDTIRQPGLNSFLKKYQQMGDVAFYQGPVAQDIVSTVNENNGEMTVDDFKSYKVRWLEPLTQDFEGYRLYLMPPPSSGGLVLKTAFTLIEKMNLKQYKPLSIDELHLLGEIMSRSFRARSLLGDPDYNKNPISDLTSNEYIDSLKNSISMTKATSLKPVSKNSEIFEKSETTNFSVMDNQNNAIAITFTLNGNFGSGLFSDKFGIALNNEMDDFTTKPGEPNMFGLIQGEANKVEGGKRPLSSMSPTIVEKIDEKNGENETIMAIGAPGGPRIINGVLQAIYRTLVSGYDMDLAIQTPRIHHQFLPDKLFLDPDRFSPEIIEGLKKRGHEMEFQKTALVYGVRKNSKGLLEGAFDSRGPGGAGGF